MKLSICIPTYNRPEQLPNCLESIYLAKKRANLRFNVCISDNNSNYDIKKIIDEYKKKLDITFNSNKKNIGYQANLLKAISLSDSEYIWAIGDDDLLMPNSLSVTKNLFENYEEVDFFYVNSYHLDYSYIKKYKRPFDTSNLPKNMEKLSKKEKPMKCEFWDLIDYNVSFDFLMGNFANIFKKRLWDENLKCLDDNLLRSVEVGSNLDSTCGYIKVYANAFKNSKAYFCPEGLSVNCSGIREWAPLYEFMEIIILPKMLDYYRSKGLSMKSYLINKNYSLRNFSNFFLKIIIRGNKAGLDKINFYESFFLNLLYPNVYLSIFYFLYRKLIKLIKGEKL